MKREMIENVLKGLDIKDEDTIKKIVDSVMVEYGKAFKEKDQEIDTLRTTNEGLETQLKETKDNLDKLSEVDVDKITEELEDLKKKYDTDTKALNEKISQKNYEYKVKELVNDLKFSSESAKKNFLREITEKNLKLEDDKLIGFNDFVSSYKKSDPSAFVSEKPKDKKDTIVNLGGKHKEEGGDDTPTTLLDSLKEKYNE